MPAVQLPRFVVFGEALTDLIRQDDGERWLARPGGSPWNLARVAARLGVETGFAGAVSRDVFGEEILKRSREAGVDLRFLQQVEPGLPAALADLVAEDVMADGAGEAGLDAEPRHDARQVPW